MVVEHHLNLDLGVVLRVQRLQPLHELPTPVPGAHQSQPLARHQVNAGEQRAGPQTLVLIIPLPRALAGDPGL